MKTFVNGIVKNESKAGKLGIIRLATWGHGSDFEKAPGFKSAGNNLKRIDLKVIKGKEKWTWKDLVTKGGKQNEKHER